MSWQPDGKDVVPPNVPTVSPPAYEEVAGPTLDIAETNVDEEDIPKAEETSLLAESLDPKAIQLAKQLAGLRAEGQCPLASGEDTDGEESPDKVRRRLTKYGDAPHPNSPHHDDMEMNPLGSEPQVPFVDDLASEPEEELDNGDAVGDNRDYRYDSFTGRVDDVIEMQAVRVCVDNEWVRVQDLPADMEQDGQEPRHWYDVEVPQRPVTPTKLEGFVEKVKALSPTKKLLILLAIIFIPGIILLVTLLPASFVYIEYYEYALSRNKWTGVVDYDTTYDYGCHLMAPQDEMVRFQSTAHHIDKDIALLTNESLWVNIQVTMQYFLKRDDIGRILKKYDFNYDTVVRNLIESSVKILAVKFSLDQFRLERQFIESKIRDRLRYVLSGDCCDACCNGTCKGHEKCHATKCRLIGQCYTGHFVDLKYFQLGRLWVPESVTERYMRRVVLQINAEREYFVQQKAVEVKQTEREVKDLLNKAKEEREVAKAKRHLILTRSEAQASRDKEIAYQKAMRSVFSHLNMTSEEHKLSFMFVRTLEDIKPKVSRNYGFNVHTSFN